MTQTHSFLEHVVPEAADDRWLTADRRREMREWSEDWREEWYCHTVAADEIIAALRAENAALRAEMEHGG